MSDRVDQRAPAPLTRALPLAILLALAACTNAPDTKAKLVARGYTGIMIEPYRWNTCHMAQSATPFRAVDAAGNPVEGIACESMDGTFEIRLY